MRKEHPAFKMPTADLLSTHLEFMDLEPGLVGYTITQNANGDTWENIMVLFNANKTKVPFIIDEKAWTMAFNLEKGYHRDGLKVKGKFMLDPISAYVFYK